MNDQIITADNFEKTPKSPKRNSDNHCTFSFSLGQGLHFIMQGLSTVTNCIHPKNYMLLQFSGLLGPYFPRRHTKVIVSSKSVARPAVPELNMFLHPSFLDSPKVTTYSETPLTSTRSIQPLALQPAGQYRHRPYNNSVNTTTSLLSWSQMRARVSRKASLQESNSPAEREQELHESHERVASKS